MTIMRYDLSNTFDGPARRKCDICGVESGPLKVWENDVVSEAFGWNFKRIPITKKTIERQDVCPNCVSKI